MTTTQSATEAEEPELHDEEDRRPDAIRRWVYPVILGFMALATMGALIAAGMPASSGGPYRYAWPGNAATIVLVYNLALMVWPTFKALSNLRLTENKTRAKVSLVVVAISVVVSLIFLLVAKSYDTPNGINIGGMIDYGEALWVVPFLGPFLALVALALHAIAAGFLAHGYVVKNEQLREDEQMLPHRESAASTAKAEFEIAVGVQATAAAELTRVQEEHEPLTTAVQECATVYTEAKTAYEESEAFKKQAAATKEIADLLERRQGLIGQIDLVRSESAAKRPELVKKMEALQARIDKLRAGPAKAELQDEYNALEVELEALRDATAPLQADSEALQARSVELEGSMDALNATLAGSPEKVALDAAEAASNAAVEAEDKHRKEELEPAKKASTEADKEAARLGTVQTDAEKLRDDTQTRINEAELAARLTWRDSSFIPVSLMVLMVLFYPIWVGWPTA